MDTGHTLTNVYRQADRLLLFIPWAMFVISLALSGIHGMLKFDTAGRAERRSRQLGAMKGLAC